MPPMPRVSAMDLKIDHSAGLIAADLNGIYHEISAAESFFPVLHAQVGLQAGHSAVDILVDDGQNLEALVQTNGVDVVQRDLAVPQNLRTHHIADDVAHEHSTARAHKCNLHIGISSLIVFRILSV